MKKLVVVILLAILCTAGWAVATYITAGKVESRYAELLKQYGHWGPFTLTEQSYTRGFLSSRAKTILEMKIPQGPQGAKRNDLPESLRLVFEETFHHGPLPFGTGPDGQRSWSPALALVETRLVSITPGQEEFTELQEQVPELKHALALSRVDFDGSLTSRIQVPPFDQSIDGDRVSWGGLQFACKYAAIRKTLTGSLNMPQMSLQTDGSEMTWNGIHGRFDLHEAVPLVYVGTSKMAFGAMQMSLPKNEKTQSANVLMKGFEISSDSHCDGKLLQYNQTMKFAGVTVAGQTFGPGIFILEAKNMDAEEFGRFQSQLQQIYRSDQDFTPEKLMPQLLPLYRQLVEKLLAGTPEVNIRQLHFATPMGDIDGQVLVKFAGHPGLTMDDPKTLLPYLDAAVDLSVHKNLVTAVLANSIKSKLKVARARGTIQHYSDQEIELLAQQQVSSQLDALVAQNFITRDGESIKARATFKQGKLVLNGRSLPLFQSP